MPDIFENVFDLVRDFSALVGVHKNPINEKFSQLGCQSFGVKNRSCGLLPVVVPCLFFLLLFHLCQIECCGSFHLLFQRDEYCLFQFRRIDLPLKLCVYASGSFELNFDGVLISAVFRR